MTPQLLPNLTSGNSGQASQIMSTMGISPVGNAGGSNMPGPTGMNALAALPTATGAPGIGTGVMPAPGTASTTPGTIPTAGVANPIPVPGVGVPSGAVPGAIPGSQTANSSKQLNDVFGKGIGGDIQSVISNLGSGDSSYMQAYAAAMAPQNAENLATLNTTLGNSGVSANSSTAAIANADFQSNIVGQEGLQEAQLQQTDEQNLIGLLQGTEGAANKEASTSVWGDIGSVLGAVGSDVSNVLSLKI